MNGISHFGLSANPFANPFAPQDVWDPTRDMLGNQDSASKKCMDSGGTWNGYGCVALPESPKKETKKRYKIPEFHRDEVPVENTAMAASTTETKKSSMMLYLGIALGAVAVLGVGYAVVKGGSSEPERASNPRKAKR